MRIHLVAGSIAIAVLLTGCGGSSGGQTDTPKPYIGDSPDGNFKQYELDEGQNDMYQDDYQNDQFERDLGW